MTPPLFIPLVLGTQREGRQTAKVAKVVLGAMKSYGWETELVEATAFNLTKTEDGDKAKGWLTMMARADGLIIVSPEYNHGYPGELKLFLDSAYQEYNRKPLGICGVSSGGLGGARMVEQLRLVSIELQLVPIRNAVYFSNVTKLFDEQDNLLDPSYHERLKKMFDELDWYARVLKQGRESK